MDNVYFVTGFEEALRCCQEGLKNFQGSEKTLQYIKRIEECLRRLADETKHDTAIETISLGEL